MKIGKYGQQQCWYWGEGGDENDDEKLEFNEVTDEKIDTEIETLASEDCEVWPTAGERWWGEWGEYSSQLKIWRERVDKMNDDKQGHKDAKI